MDVHGEGVFATRPWKIFGEGSARSGGGMFSEGRTNYTAQDIRFTVKDSNLYAFAMAWPENGKITVKSLALNSKNYPAEIAKVELLGNKGPLVFTRQAEGLVVTMPDKKPNDYAYALKITPK
jgi:alpha-L-fucosidase